MEPTVYLLVYDQQIMDAPSVPVYEGVYTTLEAAEAQIEWLLSYRRNLPRSAFDIVPLSLSGDLACWVAGVATKHAEEGS